MTTTTTVSLDDVRAAAERLQGIAHRTPLATSRTLDQWTGRTVFLKCEQLQRGGAFKFRGAYNTISRLGEEQRRRGVVAFSSGNHAQGVALAAQLLGVRAVICMPDDAPPIKVAATTGYGAEVRQYNRLTDDREAFTRAVGEELGLTLVPPFDHPDIMAGAGTAALELLEHVPDLDTILAPIGGGGLFSGTAVAAHGLNAAITLFGVEPAAPDDTAQSLRAGKRVAIPPPQTIADGLRPPMPGVLTFPVIQQHAADILLVSEEDILEAMRFAMLRMKMVLEPSGAVPLAAVLSGKLPAAARRVGVILSGGNVDPSLLATMWDG